MILYVFVSNLIRETKPIFSWVMLDAIMDCYRKQAGDKTADATVNTAHTCNYVDLSEVSLDGYLDGDIDMDTP